jgi:hypothetical protein
MALTGFTGTQLAIKIGVPGANFPTATYAAGPGVATGGLPLITAIADVPAVMLELATERSKDFKPVKKGERVKVHNGPEDGIFLQQADGFTGSSTVILVRSTNDNSVYDPAVEILLQAASVPNQRVYVEFYRFLDRTATNSRYHLQAGSVLVDMNGQVNADELYQMEQFTFTGTGSFINGYFHAPLN